MVTIAGPAPAAVRLVDDLLGRIDGALVVRGAFSRLTPAIGLGPLPEIVAALEGGAASGAAQAPPWMVAARRDALGIADTPPRELGEIYAAVGHLVDEQPGPVVIALDGVDLAGHGFLNLVAFLAARQSRRGLLIVSAAGPGFEPPPAWAGEAFQTVSFQTVSLGTGAGSPDPRAEQDPAAHVDAARSLLADGAAATRPELVGAHLQLAGSKHEAAAYFGRAGHRSLQRSDMPSAADLLTRSASLRPSGDHDRLMALAAACDALLAIGHVEEAARIARDGVAEARSSGDECAAARLALWDTLLGDEPPASDELRVRLDEAAGVLEGCGDSTGLAQAAETRAHLLWDEADPDGATTAMQRALDHARAGGDRPTTARAVVWLLSHELWGPEFVVDAIARCDDFAWTGEWSALVEVKRVIVRAALVAAAEGADRSGELVASARALQARLGQPSWVAGVPQVAAWIALLRGDAATAEAEVGPVFEELAAHGHPSALDTGLLLARALADRGRAEEARDVAVACERMSAGGGGDDLQPARGELVAVRLRAEATLGGADLDSGALLASLPPPYRPLQRGDALLDLAEAHKAAGDRTEARRLLEDALALYEGKQALTCATRARKALADLVP